MPEHIHTVIEFLYVYAGHCTQIIRGRVEMSAGDICLLDTNVLHSIITIEMRKDYLTHGLLQQLGQKGIIAGKAGYENPGFFYQKFQQIYGMTDMGEKKQLVLK